MQTLLDATAARGQPECAGSRGGSSLPGMDCHRGGTGRRRGLKIRWEATPVPVRARPVALRIREGRCTRCDAMSSRSGCVAPDRADPGGIVLVMRLSSVPRSRVPFRRVAGGRSVLSSVTFRRHDHDKSRAGSSGWRVSHDILHLAGLFRCRLFDASKAMIPIVLPGDRWPRMPLAVRMLVKDGHPGWVPRFTLHENHLSPPRLRPKPRGFEVVDGHSRRLSPLQP